MAGRRQTTSPSTTSVDGSSPARVATQPEIDGISLAVRYWPAGAVTIVGGDFYDVFPLGDERWAIVIGDVCGSGPNAAAVTAIAQRWSPSGKTS